MQKYDKVCLWKNLDMVGTIIDIDESKKKPYLIKWDKPDMSLKYKTDGGILVADRFKRKELKLLTSND